MKGVIQKKDGNTPVTILRAEETVQALTFIFSYVSKTDTYIRSTRIQKNQMS